jgi:hypothetical protein
VRLTSNQIRRASRQAAYIPLQPCWLGCHPDPIDPHAAVGGLLEAFEEVLDLGRHLRILHGLGRSRRAGSPRAGARSATGRAFRLKIGYNCFCANRCRVVSLTSPTVVGRHSPDTVTQTEVDGTSEAEAIRRRDRDGETVREIARSYNVSHSTISRLTA